MLYLVFNHHSSLLHNHDHHYIFLLFWDWFHHIICGISPCWDILLLSVLWNIEAFLRLCEATEERWKCPIILLHIEMMSLIALWDNILSWFTNCKEWAKHPKCGIDASCIAFVILLALSVITTCTCSSEISHFSSMVRIWAAMYSPVWASVRWAFKTADFLLNWPSIQCAVRLSKEVSFTLELQASVSFSTTWLSSYTTIVNQFKYLLFHGCVDLRNNHFNVLK